MMPSTFDQEGILPFFFLFLFFFSSFFFFNARLLKDKVFASLCAHVSER